MANSAIPCAGCGFTAPAGSRDCRGLFEELCARDFGDYRYGRVHRRMVDAYCLQHPKTHCVSAKSLAAHLVGLCIALEHDSEPAAHRALLRWLDGRSPVSKPELPAYRGAFTIGDAAAANDPEAYAAAVQDWARSTWDAYAALHPLAREWLRAALAR